MSEVKTKPKQETHVALKNLCTLGGVQIKKGKSFKCDKKEADYLKSNRAI